MLFRYFYFSNVLLLWFCLLMKESFSTSDELIENNSSSVNFRNRILPTPLIRDFNNSVAEVLRQQANNMFVSNTSINDFISDNDTQQMLLRYRERKRQARIMTIQREILMKLGLDQQPNVTSRMSDEQRRFLMQSFDRRRTKSNESMSATPCEEGQNQESC